MSANISSTFSVWRDVVPTGRASHNNFLRCHRIVCRGEKHSNEQISWDYFLIRKVIVTQFSSAVNENYFKCERETYFSFSRSIFFLGVSIFMRHCRSVLNRLMQFDCFVSKLLLRFHKIRNGNSCLMFDKWFAIKNTSWKLTEHVLWSKKYCQRCGWR